MRIIIYLVCIALLIKKVYKRKSIIDIVLIIALLLPDIGHVEASNFLLGLLLLVITTCNKDRRYLLSKEMFIYVGASLLIFLIQMISWAGNNAEELFGALVSAFAFIKYPLIILCLSIYENEIKTDAKEMIDRLYIVITAVNIVDLFSCVFQKADKNAAFALFSKWYSYSDFYVRELLRLNRYYRAYGVWDSPMAMGTASLLTFCLLLCVKELKAKRTWILNLVCAFTLGVFSLTKTFFLGVTIFFIIYYLIHIASAMNMQKLTFSKIVGILVMILSIPIIINSVNYIYDWSHIRYPYLHYYLGFLYRPFDAFSSRMSDSGSLTETFDIIENNWIIGVGPLSVSGELIGDNAYVVLLHNGGIVALLLAMFVFASWILKLFCHNNWYKSLFLVIWLLCGFSLPVVMNYRICLLPAFCYLILEGRLFYEKSANDCEAS